MALIGFLQASNAASFAGSWRHPEARTDFSSPDYYRHIGRVLEDAKFDLAFFDDRLSMPDMYGNDHALAVQHGIRCVKMDAATVLTVMGTATSHLGLGATYSTTYFEPFHVARLFATIDLMTGGRSAWNVVTSLNDAEAANMGNDVHLPHDMRYDRAEEFMQIVLGHWNSWEPDAIVQDKVNRVFADPQKVRRLDFQGSILKSHGTFTVPSSPQGHPVVIQAGSSGRGKAFAARWAELVFALYPNLALAKREYADLKQQVVQAGRDPSDVKIAPLIHVITGQTQTEAEEKKAFIDTLSDLEDSLSLLSEVMNFDFSTVGLDDPLSDADLARMSGAQVIKSRVLEAVGDRVPTPRDFVAMGGQGVMANAWVGGPREIADRMEEWFVDHAADGFVIGATHVPGGYEDFTRHVVPELQRRGLSRTEYESSTLRGNLGLPFQNPGRRE
jgi:FMN-dependent oxidoreductase (nitrilotriacetate monooxygenase family)